MLDFEDYTSSQIPEICRKMLHYRISRHDALKLFMKPQINSPETLQPFFHSQNRFPNVCRCAVLDSVTRFD